MSDHVDLTVDGKTCKLPLILGYDGSRAVDITSLRNKTGLITYDPGFSNTGACKSKITFIDGEKGILRYRGIPVEELAENAKFTEVAYLLINGDLPDRKEMSRFSMLLTDNSLVHEDMKFFFQKFPKPSDPLGILTAMVSALKSFYPYILDEDEEIDITVTRLLSKIRTLAAMSYKISKGHKVVIPRHDLTYCANFLNMMFDSPVQPYVIDEDIVDALNTSLILHADHEQNCSTTAVRVVGSSRVNLFATISAGMAALWGPIHGAADRQVIQTLKDVFKNRISLSRLIERAKNPDENYFLPGVGHRIYKTYDPRAKILKQVCDRIHQKQGKPDPLFEIAMELEEKVLNDEYFIETRQYPNINFYSGVLLRKIGIPSNMFTVMYAIGRLPGWIANWKEMNDNPKELIIRPRQIYIGPPQMKFIPLDDRVTKR